MSNKRVSEMTDDEIRASAGATIQRDGEDPVETLHRIADQVIGGNAPPLADELHDFADRLAADMRGERRSEPEDAARDLCVDPSECVNGPSPHQWHISCQRDHDPTPDNR